MKNTTFYSDGTAAYTVSFRIDNPEDDSRKMIVCGCCVPKDQHFDARTSIGHHPCEMCGEKLGRREAHQIAMTISA